MNLFLLSLFVVIVGCWLLTPKIVSMAVGGDAPTQGQYGDLFGSINALFSGLALFGVVVAVALQWREIRSQNEEMKVNLEIQQKMIKALSDAVYARSFDKVYDILDEDKVLTARRVVERELGPVPFPKWKDLPDWDEKERNIKVLLRAYNIAGIIVKNGYLPAQHMIPFWEPSLLSTWKILKPYLVSQRELRGSNNHWSNYDFLVEEAVKLTADKSA